MGRGIVSAGKLRTEGLRLTPRTSDPSGTSEGEGWIRSDVAPEDNQIGTFRFDTGGSTLDLPIYPVTADVGDGVSKRWRVVVDGTQGFIPVTDSSPDYPAVGVWDGATRYGATDLSAIPDIGDYQWYVDAGSGTTVEADLGSVLGTLDDASMWVSNSAATGGYALDHQATYSWVTDTTILDPPFTVCGWIKPASYASDQVWMGQAGGDMHVKTASSETLTTSFGGSSYINGTFVPAGNWGFAALSIDSSPSEHRLITFDNSQELSDNTNGNWTNIDDNLEVGDYNNSNSNLDGLSDFHVVSEGALLSKTEITEVWEATKR
jgi:hypothetical protein